MIPKLWCERIKLGTEEFWVPAALAAAGVGVQQYNTSQANSKQQAGEVQTILDQQKIQQQARGGVNALTKSIASNTPDQIANQATGAYVNQLRKNAVGSQSGGGNGSSVLFGAPTSSLPTNIGGSSRYNADTKASQNQVQDYGSTLAGEMGNIDAATRQRQNEGLAMGTEATALTGLGAQSYTQNFVDQLKSNAAGQASPWLTLLSGALSGGANAASKNVGTGVPDDNMSASSAYGGTTTPSGYVNQGGYLVNTPGGP